MDLIKKKYVKMVTEPGGIFYEEFRRLDELNNGPQLNESMTSKQRHCIEGEHRRNLRDVHRILDYKLWIYAETGLEI